MNVIKDLLPQELIYALGWTIIHSVWQGALIAIVLAVVLVLMKRFTAQTRYYMIMTALLTMLALSVLTFAELYQPRSSAPKSEVIVQLPQEQTNSQIQTDAEINIPQQEVEQDFSLIQLGHIFSLYFNRHMPSIVTLWFLGMLIFLLKFLGSLAYTQRLKHYRTQPISDIWQEKVDRLCQKLYIERAVTTLKSGVAHVPMVIGYLKPVILLPGSLFTGLTTQQIENILAHELAHVARHDYLLNLIQSCIEVLYFYHPAVWWISSCLRSEREHCCDDIAVKISGDSQSFARTLADLQEKCLEGSAMAMALTGSRNKLFQRIHRLVSKPKIKSSFSEGFFSALVIIICLSVVAFSMKKRPQTERGFSEIIQSDSTVTADVPGDDSPDKTEDMQSRTEGLTNDKMDPDEVTESISQPPEDKAPLPPDEISDTDAESIERVAQQVESVSRQINKEEKEIYKQLRELEKQDRQIRSRDIKIKEKALENYQNVLRKYERSNMQWDNDVNFDGLSFPETAEPLGSPIPAVIPDVAVDWLGTGDNQLIAAVNSGNIDSVRACLPESDVNARTFTGWTALMEAAKTGHEEIAGLLLEHNANPEIRSNEGRTALWIAAYYGHTDVIKRLLNRKAEIDAKDNEGYTPLFAAIIKNQFKATDVLLDEGANINTVSFRGETALIIAIRQKSSIAHHLIFKGADINRPDNSGNSPLLIALEEDLIDISMRLVEEGAYVNARNPEGESPLLYSIRHKHIPLANLIIEKGADVNLKNNYGQTPLLAALNDELYELVNKLIERKADVNITDHRGNTPLLIAIKERLHTLALKIIENKADINKKNVQGDTPLLYALYYDMNEIALLLIEKGAALNVTNREGLSPLGIAVSDNKIELAHLMLEKGANPDVKDENGTPILLTALNDGLTETAKLIIDKGADINITDNDGITPLLMAIDEHYVDICRILIERGADVNRKDSQNRSALSLADENELYEISALLKEKGAKQ